MVFYYADYLAYCVPRLKPTLLQVVIIFIQNNDKFFRLDCSIHYKILTGGVEGGLGKETAGTIF